MTRLVFFIKGNFCAKRADIIRSTACQKSYFIVKQWAVGDASPYNISALILLEIKIFFVCALSVDTAIGCYFDYAVCCGLEYLMVM